MCGDEFQERLVVLTPQPIVERGAGDRLVDVTVISSSSSFMVRQRRLLMREPSSH
jgi:hypothetical protein